MINAQTTKGKFISDALIRIKAAKQVKKLQNITVEKSFRLCKWTPDELYGGILKIKTRGDIILATWFSKTT